MPGDRPPYLARALRQTVEGAYSTGENEIASANTGDSLGVCLATPPRDVERLLDRHDARLPRYLDTHLQRSIAESRERWPLLRGLAAIKERSA